MAIRIEGKWDEGRALAPSTLSSKHKKDGNGEFLYYPNGKKIYDTKRCTIGEAMFQLKNRKNRAGGNILVQEAAKYLRNNWKIIEEIDLIVGTPSSKYRPLQPVEYIVNGLSNELSIPCDTRMLRKNSSQEIKDLSASEKKTALRGTIIKNRVLKGEKNILLVDDLYSTGSTLNSAVEKLKEDPNVKKIYVLTMTKNRTR